MPEPDKIAFLAAIACFTQFDYNSSDMLDIKAIRENPDLFKKALARKGAGELIDKALEIDRQRREAQVQHDELKSRQNTLSREVGKKKATGEDASDLIAEIGSLPGKIKELDKDTRKLAEETKAILLEIPNPPHESVPDGKSEEDNREERIWGAKPDFPFKAEDHADLGEKLGILDFERAAKIAGARFSLSIGPGAKLERALMNLMLDTHTNEHGYTEVLPPFMANTASLTGTGNLPKFEDDLFKVAGTDNYLIPTAEVPVTNMYRDEILDQADLPVKFAAYTPCFRSEAGSYGKDTRGLIRLHQFNKVELVKFSAPETSYDELESLTKNAETILQKLGLHYRVVTLCTAELSFSSAKTYDLEVWMPGQSAYREISSCSNFSDFQARRANIRFRPKGTTGKPKFVHTLNGSGLAIGRTVAAILENFQQEDGSVIVPEALRGYMGMDVIQ